LEKIISLRVRATRIDLDQAGYNRQSARAVFGSLIELDLFAKRRTPPASDTLSHAKAAATGRIAERHDPLEQDWQRRS
jgi:hypothetical protein